MCRTGNSHPSSSFSWLSHVFRKCDTRFNSSSCRGNIHHAPFSSFFSRDVNFSCTEIDIPWMSYAQERQCGKSIDDVTPWSYLEYRIVKHLSLQHLRAAIIIMDTKSSTGSKVRQERFVQWPSEMFNTFSHRKHEKNQCSSGNKQITYIKYMSWWSNQNTIGPNMFWKVKNMTDVFQEELVEVCFVWCCDCSFSWYLTLRVGFLNISIWPSWYFYLTLLTFLHLMHDVIPDHVAHALK